MKPVLRAVAPITAAFLTVATLSTGLVVGLGWMLFHQDRELENARLQERRAQIADRFAAKMQPVLSDKAFPEQRALPANTALLTVEAGRISAPPTTILYYPDAPSPLQEAPARIFGEGERLEYANNDLAAAERVFATLAGSENPTVRAGALGRLARVQRKAGKVQDALAAYDQLASVPDDIAVEGFPATMYAKLGRASALQKRAGDPLQNEARALWSDLQIGRWRISGSEYAARKQEVSEWLGAEVLEDPARLSLTQAVEWLWQNRQSLTTPGYRRLTFPTTEAIAVWLPINHDVRAAVADASQISTLLTDVSPELPSRRNALGSALAGIGIVLLAGWYFILRSLTRERRALTLQSEFVAAVSHEFRTPLTSITQVAEMLDDGRVPPESRRASYRALVRDSHRLRRLVEDLLDFRRFESGSASLQLESVNVPDLVKAVATDFQTQAAPTGYVVDVTTQESLIYVSGDRDALRRALWNLLDNAVKYSPGSQKVWVSVTRESGRVAITVRDQGLGIPLEEHSYVFERFARGSQAKSMRIRGTGIGLAIVRQIIHEHGGHVSLASQLGTGSRFTLFLPDAAGGAR